MLHNFVVACTNEIVQRPRKRRKKMRHRYYNADSADKTGLFIPLLSEQNLHNETSNLLRTSPEDMVIVYIGN